jgi:hypothetical protein
MLLIQLLKILFSALIIRHIIRWVSYHIHHHNKKARVFHGNCRMPFDVEFALIYGINALTKTRFKVIDLSYRKTLLQWKLLLNEIYPHDNLYFTRQPRLNRNPILTTLPSHTHTNLKSHSRNLGVTTGKRKPFPALKTGNQNPNYFTLQSHTNTNPNLAGGRANARSRGGCILKISQNPIPFPK